MEYRDSGDDYKENMEFDKENNASIFRSKVSKNQELKMDRKKIGINLLKIRVESGFTQDDVKMKSGLTPKQIIDLEKGRTNYTIDSLLAYLDALGKKLKDIT